MALQVIGAGYGRTGTMSMKLALERLDLGPCHHMVEAFARPADFPAWAAGIRGEPWDPPAVLEGFRSQLDFPGCLVWRDLLERWPDAKVLLTVRPAEDWWRSFDATIGPSLRTMVETDDVVGAREMFDAICTVAFDDRSEERDVAVGAYEAHNAAVIAEVPADRLLVYETGSGWEPLCAFLGVPVPDEPFPRTNTTEEFLARKEEQARGDHHGSAAGSPTAAPADEPG